MKKKNAYFENHKLNVITSLFTLNSKQLVKTVKKLFNLHTEGYFNPSKRAILKTTQCIILKLKTMQSNHPQPMSLPYRKDCIDFQTFCCSLTNMAVLTVINYLVGMEI